jgi:hypothetical protein
MELFIKINLRNSAIPLGFIIRIYHDARPSECQNLHTVNTYSKFKKNKHNKPGNHHRLPAPLTSCSCFTKELTTFPHYAKVILEDMAICWWTSASYLAMTCSLNWGFQGGACDSNLRYMLPKFSVSRQII